MRKDMAKVVTERPRSNSRARNRKSKLKLRSKDLDEDMDCPGPKKLGMSMYARDMDWNDEKSFTDVLGPIERWLHKQARKKRPWDKVYSEIRAALPANTTEPVRHIWDAHVKHQIALHCRMGADGKIYRIHIYGVMDEVNDEFYVHPVTGLFLYAPKKKREAKKEPITSIPLDELTKLEKKNGIWYINSYTKLEETIDYTGMPAWRKYLGPKTKISYTLTGSKQLNKKELKYYNLENENIP